MNKGLDFAAVSVYQGYTTYIFYIALERSSRTMGTLIYIPV